MNKTPVRSNLPPCYNRWLPVAPLAGAAVVLVGMFVLDKITWENIPPLYADLAPEKLDPDAFFATDFAARTFWTVSTFVYIIAGFYSIAASAIYISRPLKKGLQSVEIAFSAFSPHVIAQSPFLFSFFRFVLSFYTITLLVYIVALPVVFYALTQKGRDYFTQHTFYTLSRISCEEERLSKEEEYGYEFITTLIGLERVNRWRKGQCDFYEPYISWNTGAPVLFLDHSTQASKVNRWRIWKQGYNTWWDLIVARLRLGGYDPNLSALLSPFTITVIFIFVIGIGVAIYPDEHRFVLDGGVKDEEKPTTEKGSTKATRMNPKETKREQEPTLNKKEIIDKVAKDLEQQQRRLLTLLYLGSVFLISGVVAAYALLRFPVSFVSEASAVHFHSAAVTGTAIVGVVFSVLLVAAYLPASIVLSERVRDALDRKKALHQERQILSEKRGKEASPSDKGESSSSTEKNPKEDSFDKEKWLEGHGLASSSWQQLTRATAVLSPLLLGLFQILLSRLSAP